MTQRPSSKRAWLRTSNSLNKRRPKNASVFAYALSRSFAREFRGYSYTFDGRPESISAFHPNFAIWSGTNPSKLNLLATIRFEPESVTPDLERLAQTFQSGVFKLLVRQDSGQQVREVSAVVSEHTEVGYFVVLRDHKPDQLIKQAPRLVCGFDTVLRLGVLYDLPPKKVAISRETFPLKLTHGRSRHERQALYRRGCGVHQGA